MSSNIEPPYYYINERDWYKGNFPVFYESKDIPASAILRDNYPVIKAEIIDFFSKQGKEIKPNFTPYSYREAGWRTVNLFSYFMKYSKKCAYFPKTTKIVESIPGMSGAQIAVLYPRTRIKAHFGDSNAFVRTHIGIKIPGTLPEIGFRVKNKEVCWKEGDVFSFCAVHRHYAWNNTDEIRIMFQVDTFRPEYLSKKYTIAGNILSSMATKYMATKYRFLRKMPRSIVNVTHISIGFIFTIILLLQVKLNFNLAELFEGFKKN